MEFALSATIHLGPGVSIDGYLMPDGSFRYGLSYTSILFGYAENYYRRLLRTRRTKNKPKKLEALLEKGFTAYQKQVRASRSNKGGSSVAHTVSYSDSSVQKPEVLTSEVLVFFALLAFLAVFGFRRVS